ncbi:MAG: undecaprenyl-diphosphatase UppP [Firmicutes bacterium]|nr:undecaprenyl-diphosphatase UppP [Bacillota bacterium]
MSLNYFQAIILGLIQGATEFLPVSSSAHLLITRNVFHFPDPSKTYDIMLHMGTLIALVIYFRKDLINIAKGVLRSLFKGKLYGEPAINLFWFLCISTIPAGLFGVKFGDQLENINNTYLISSMLIIFGIVLFLADKKGRKEKKVTDVTWKDALIVGLFQAIALFPGVSRSGICMTAALMLGLTRKDSARYSFLISVPLITAISLHGLISLFKHHPNNGELTMYAVGMLAAVISGFVCIKYLLNFLNKNSFFGFTVYRVILGMLLIILAVAGVIR